MGIWSGVGNGQSEHRPTLCQVVATVVRCSLEHPVGLTPHRVLAYEASNIRPGFPASGRLGECRGRRDAVGTLHVKS